MKNLKDFINESIYIGELKYKFTKDTIKSEDGHTLHRIQATKNFGDVKEGDLGGYIESEENLIRNDGECWVYDDAMVWGKAKVSGGAKVRDDAMVSGNAIIRDYAEIYGDAQVYDKVEIKDDVKVYGSAEVYGDAQIRGKAQVYGSAEVYGDVEISDNAKVYGNAKVYDKAHVTHDAQIYGNAEVYGEPYIYDGAEIFDNAKVYGKAPRIGNMWGDTVKICGNSIVYGNTSVNIPIVKDKKVTKDSEGYYKH